MAEAVKLLEAVSMLLFPPQTSHSILHLQVVGIPPCLYLCVAGYTCGLLLAMASL